MLFVVQVEHSYLECYRTLAFLTIEQFIGVFAMTPKEAKVPVESLHDEWGEPCQGVLLQDDASLSPKFRRVRLAHRSAVQLADHLQESSMQLRADQGKEVYDYVKTAVGKSRTPRLARGKGMPPTPQDIHDLKNAADSAAAAALEFRTQKL